LILGERGRPSVYDEEIADRICELLAGGRSLLSICQSDEAFPPDSTVRQWAIDDREGFAAKYARSRELGLLHRADEIVEIADSEPDPNKARVRVDARKWELSKLMPRIYGDKIDHTLSGPDGGPIMVVTGVAREDDKA
jgi:hypothetical protein